MLLLCISQFCFTQKGSPNKKSHVRLFATPWTIQFLEFSRPEYQNGQPFPSPGDLPNRGNKPRSPALQADSLPPESPGKPTNTDEASATSNNEDLLPPPGQRGEGAASNEPWRKQKKKACRVRFSLYPVGNKLRK